MNQQRLLRVVVDPNVVVSAALKPQGPPGEVLRAGLVGVFRLVVCPYLITELDEVLRRPKFRRWISLDEALVLVAGFRDFSETHSDPARAPVQSRDPEDDYLVALAVETAADLVVSGDRDLLALDAAPIRVLAPRAFLDHLRDNAQA